MRKKIRRYILSSLKIGIAIFVFLYLFRIGWLTKGTFAKLFRIDNVLSIVVSSFFFFTAQVLCASRLVLLLKTINFPLRLFRAFKLVMIGNFFNTVIPGMVGGDVVKGFYLVKSDEEKRIQSAGIVITDRVLGFLTLTFIGGVSLAYLLGQRNASLDSHRYESYIVLAVIASVFSLFSIIFMFGRNPRFRDKMKALFVTLFRKSLFYDLAESFGDLVKHHRILVYSFCLSILIQLISLAGLLILCNIVSGVFPNVVTLTAVSSVVILLGVLPVTPGNIGWTELIAAFGWSAVGSNAGAEIFFYWRLVTVLCSIPGGLLYLSYNEDRSSLKHSEK